MLQIRAKDLKTWFQYKNPSIFTNNASISKFFDVLKSLVLALSLRNNVSTLFCVCATGENQKHCVQRSQNLTFKTWIRHGREYDARKLGISVCSSLFRPENNFVGPLEASHKFWSNLKLSFFFQTQICLVLAVEPPHPLSFFYELWGDRIRGSLLCKAHLG